MTFDFKTEPESLKECFYFDEHEINPTPRGWIKKMIVLYYSPRYSMPVFMRLSQYFYIKSLIANNFITRNFY